MKYYFLTFLLFIAMSSTGQSGHLKDAQPLLHYLARQPMIKIDRPPLILLLHGIGSNEKDLFSFANVLPDKFLVVSARAPYVMGNESYAWYNVDFSSGKPVINARQAEESRKLILKFIDQLEKIYHIDETQVYLLGFSQGAIMSYSVGLTNPTKVRGMAIMSGRLLEEVKPQIAKSEQVHRLNVFISHGTRDKVLDIHYARESNAYLKTLGINTDYNEYADGHTINQDMLADLVNWLAKL